MADSEQLVKAFEAALRKVDFKEISNSAKEDNPEIRHSQRIDTSSKYTENFYEKYTEEYVEFTYNNPTIFHVVAYFADKLHDNGFRHVSEKESWNSLKPGKYFTIRNGAALAAFVVGKNWKAERGVGVIGSHIDSLTVSLKPNSTKKNIEGYELLGVAPYAGTLNDLWLDRDLGIGGRVLVRNSSTSQINQKLVDSTPHPIAHIPTLAPHFGTVADRPYNKETQAVPVIGFSGDKDDANDDGTDDEKSSPLYGKHPLKLLRYVSKLAGVKVSDILQWDLQLYDVQKGARGGLNKEFIFSPRIDDRVCSFAAIYSLIESDTDSLLESDSFSLVALFNHEEIGSGSATGAKGGLSDLVISRVLASSYFNTDNSHSQDQLKLVYANSIILSADVNHLLNPNFTNQYLENHKPVPNKGITIAVDPNGNFATDSPGLALVENLARINEDTLQYFQIRNGERSGSSIGPLMSLQTGARTIDLGIPQLSMHSIRATVGAKDIGLGIKFFNGFFANWRKTYDNYATL